MCTRSVRQYQPEDAPGTSTRLSGGSARLQATQLREWFRTLGDATANAVGTPTALFDAVAAIGVWAVNGPSFLIFAIIERTESVGPAAHANIDVLR